MAAVLTLRTGRDKSVLYRHPWIFSGSVANLTGSPAAGETVEVRAADGKPLGWAAFSPASKITARMWTFDPAETVDADFFRRRIATAQALRRAVIPAAETDALRWVHAESDGLPGLVVDQYGDMLVMQLLSAGAEYWRETFADLLLELTSLERIYERSDVEVRRLEGLPERGGPLRGELPGSRVKIIENGFQFWVDPAHGQKTGFYIDQRANREKLRRYLGLRPPGAEVLNCFCYTGGFSVYALAGGAGSVLSINSSCGCACSRARERGAQRFRARGR